MLTMGRKLSGGNGGDIIFTIKLLTLLLIIIDAVIIIEILFDQYELNTYIDYILAYLKAKMH